MSESHLQRSIQRWLAERGWFVRKIHGSAYQAAGLPDLVAVRDGSTLWIETKYRDGKLSKVQRTVILELLLAGAHVIVARSVSDVAGALEGVS